MAASKRRQDEKHLKILRELGTLLHNKQCFDCYQRGPTYVNMTIGSFVCTSCSGVLRGLNPPHRVKSISMASFSPDEIEFIKGRGNEHCRQEWMGTYDGQPPVESDSKDEQRIKDFMAMKYERKRWYVDPGATQRNKTQQLQRTSSPPPVPDSRPSTFMGNNVKSTGITQNTQVHVSRPMMQSASFPPAAVARPSLDLLGELGGDPFASSTSNNAITNNANASFANFDNFAAGPSSPPTFAPHSGPTNASSTNAFGVIPSTGTNSVLTSRSASSPPSAGLPPSKDRYAALADLDSLFNSSTVIVPPPTTAIDWDGKGSSSAGTPWPVNGASPSLFSSGVPTQPSAFSTAPSSNPFTGTNSTASTWNQQPAATSTPMPGNPFASGLNSAPNSAPRATSPSEPFSAFSSSGVLMGGYSGVAHNNANVVWGGAPPMPFAAPPTNGNYPGYKMAGPFGTWQPSAGNPFMAGVNATAPQKSTSNNPFL